MLSALDSVDDRVRGLRAGRTITSSNPSPSTSCWRAWLHSCARGGRVAERAGAAEPTASRLADLTLDRLTRRVHRGNEPIELQPKEFAMLEYFLCNVGPHLDHAP